MSGLFTSSRAGKWKFNNALLGDSVFSDYISEGINPLFEWLEHFPSLKLRWDIFLNSIKAEIISYAKSKCKNLSHERVILTNEIIRLKRLLAAGDFSVSLYIRELEKKLKKLILKELSGTKICSKAQWLEQECIQGNLISSVLDSDDVEAITGEEIECKHMRFLL